MDFLAPRLKNFLYFRKWNFLASYFSYISGGNFPRSKSKKKNTLKKFLIFPEMELSSLKKLNKNFFYLLEIILLVLLDTGMY